jgi:hypothetical protein
MEKQKYNQAFQVYPNPTTDILNVVFEQPLLTPVDVVVVDDLGRKHFQKTLSNNNNRLCVNELNAGTYRLVCSLAETEIGSCKIIVEK